MDISNSSNFIAEYGIETPDASFFVPSPGGGKSDPVSPDLCKIKQHDSSMYSHDWDMDEQISNVLPVRVPSRRLREFLDLGMQEYTGLTLKRFTIHQGRFGSVEDSSLLEAIVQSGFDDHKSVRICADGSESVHAFAAGLSEEFLNSSDAVQLRQVTVVSPDELDNDYFCVIEGIYPAVPRFRHLARTYLGIARSDRSVLHASLAATCNMVGQILLTFQPEGYVLPEQPPPSPTFMASPMVSTIESDSPTLNESLAISLGGISKTIDGSPMKTTRGFRSFIRSLFICKR